jgi:DNA-binding response OmpR family regulator
LQKRILIFDDDVDLLEVCSIVLRMKNFEVDGKHNCSAVLEDIDHFKPNVIIMDNWIPETGGVAATRKIKLSRHKNIPVVFFSANTNLTQLAAEAGADYYLHKPFDICDLENIVDQALAENVSYG